MRLLYSVMVLFLFAVSASAQSPSNQPDGPNVMVIQKKWRIDLRNAALEKDPVKAMDDREKEERKRKETERTNEILAKQGMPTTAPAARMPPLERTRRGIAVTYVYEVKVRNIGQKTIRTLVWEYVFSEPGTERELGRRRFVSTVSIRPGKTRNVVMRTSLPPAGTIDATKAGKKSRDQYSEQVVIESVTYTDGTVWESISN